MGGSVRLCAPVLILLLVAAFVRGAVAAAEEVIVIGDTEVLRIRADSGGYTAKQRADALRQRLLQIYASVGQHDVLRPEDVTLDLTPGKPAIRVRGMLLLSVTQDDARANGNTTVEDLARQWHARLRDALIRNAPLPDPNQY